MACISASIGVVRLRLYFQPYCIDLSTRAGVHQSFAHRLRIAHAQPACDGDGSVLAKITFPSPFP
jgi:hypothetical protein